MASEGKDEAVRKINQLDLKNQTKGLITKVAENINKTTAMKQLALGSVSGWTTGFLTMKVGKTAAFAVGGGIIVYQIAFHTGYVNMDWDQVKKKAQNTSKKIETQYNGAQFLSNVKRFSRANTYFTAGFVGGFLIGLAS